MPSQFGQYQSGIEAATGNLVPAYAKMAEQTANSIAGVGENIAEGIKVYAKSKEERDMLLGKIESGVNHASQFLDYAKEDTENANFVNSKSKQIADWANRAKKGQDMSIGALRALANETEIGFNNINNEFNMFHTAKVARDNKYIANVGLNETENQLKTLASQLKDDPEQIDLYKSVQERLSKLSEVRTQPTVAQGAFLTGTSEFFKNLPQTLAVSDKLKTETGLARVGKALYEVNGEKRFTLSPVEIDTLSKFYDAGKTANDNHIAMDEMLNKFRQTHNIPVSNTKIISKVFSAIRDNAKATGTRQGSALAESLSTYLDAIPQDLKEVGNVPAGSGFTTTDTSHPANVAVTDEVSKKFANSLAIDKVTVSENKETPLTEDERKAAVFAKVSKEYPDITPAGFTTWYNTLNPTKPTASVQKIGDAIAVVTTDTKGNTKVTNIPQPKTTDWAKTEKDIKEHNATTLGKLNPTTGLKEDKDAEGKPIWEDVGADADVQVSGKMQNVNDAQVVLFRQQKVAYSELLTQFKALIKLKENYSVLASRGQAPEDSEMEKRINTEMAIMKSRLQRVLYPVGQPREWENKNIVQAMPELTQLFTYNSTQLGGLDQLKIRLKNTFEEDAKGYGLLVRNKPKEDAPLTPEEEAQEARRIVVEGQAKIKTTSKK